MNKTTKISEPFGQAVLSSKHDQLTDSNLIAFNKEFDDVFELSSNEIILKDEPVNDDDLYILLDNVEVEVDDDDREIYYTTSFKIVDDKGNSIYTIEEENEASFYLSDQLLSTYKRMKKKVKPISLDDFESDSILFMVEIKNKELTEPFKVVQKILNSKDRMGATTISEVVQIFGENLIRMGIKYDLVHAETIVKGLIRKKSNELEYPDWSRNGDHHDYKLMRLNEALFKNPSPLVSMAYGDLRRQLISPDFYTKDQASHMDALFVPQLSKYL